MAYAIRFVDVLCSVSHVLQLLPVDFMNYTMELVWRVCDEAHVIIGLNVEPPLV